MITNVTTTGSSLVYVNIGGSSMPYINMQNPSAGMVRYNGNNQILEVYDGSVWVQLYGKNVDIQLSPIMQTAVDWVMKKMAEEAEWNKLAESNEAVKIAVENMRKAREQLEITTKLVKEHNE